jgi:hypothetical protein
MVFHYQGSYPVGRTAPFGNDMQIIRVNKTAWFLLFLIMFNSWCYAPGSEKVGSSSVTLGYSMTSSSYPHSVFLKSPSGAKYQLSLIPQFDVENHVVVLELVLRQAEEKVGDSNLLDVTGRLHGYQPYFFAASDFAQGAQRSIYGRSRVIDLPRLGMKMTITVTNVNVKPIESRSSGPLHFQFDDCVLQISTQGRVPRPSASP